MTLPLYDVRKRCRCGTEWTGKAFTPEPAERPGVCDACVARDAAYLATLTARRPVEYPGVGEVTPAPRVGGPESVAEVLARLPGAAPEEPR